MPQLDRYVILVQLLWFFPLSLLFIFFLSNRYLPVVVKAQVYRQSKISFFLQSSFDPKLTESLNASVCHVLVAKAEQSSIDKASVLRTFQKIWVLGNYPTVRTKVLCAQSGRNFRLKSKIFLL